MYCKIISDWTLWASLLILWYLPRTELFCVLLFSVKWDNSSIAILRNMVRHDKNKLRLTKQDIFNITLRDIVTGSKATTGALAQAQRCSCVNYFNNFRYSLPDFLGMWPTCYSFSWLIIYYAIPFKTLGWFWCFKDIHGKIYETYFNCQSGSLGKNVGVKTKTVNIF